MVEKLIPDLFQMAAYGMAVVGLDGRWLHVNPALCTMLGYHESDLLKRTLQKLRVHEGDDPSDELWPCLIGGAVENHCEERGFVSKEGDLVWLFLHVCLVRDGEGSPDRFFIQFQNTTALRRAAEMERMMFRLPVALHYIAGFDGYFKKLSPSWESTLGYSIEHLLSIPYLDLIHAEDREKTRREAKLTTECSNTFLFENRYRHADGSFRWLLWTSVTSPESELIYGVALDYSQRKEEELKLAKTVSDLWSLLEQLHASHEQKRKLRAGLLTICAWTKQIRHEGVWMPVDDFLSDHLKLNLTHGISEEAAEQMLAETLKRAASS